MELSLAEKEADGRSAGLSRQPAMHNNASKRGNKNKVIPHLLKIFINI